MTTYKVTDASDFDGHAEGEVFEAELDPEIERWALERGSIEIVKGKAKEKEEGKDG